MIFRLKTSKQTENIINEIKNKFAITPNILLRLAISLSLKSKKENKEFIQHEALKFDNSGIEFQRHTLTGDNEALYKIIMEQYCSESLTDEEFFPLHFKYHLEKGINILKSEIEFASNLEMFIKNLSNL
ncbi:MAG: DndE family protein [Cetobacterium sp.]